MKAKEKTDIEKFAEMLGRLSYMELQLFLNKLLKYDADQIFIDFVEMELEVRIGR